VNGRCVPERDTTIDSVKRSEPQR